MMSPKKMKFRKQHKGRIHGKATSGTYLSYGSFGLKATSPERITARHTYFPGCSCLEEAARSAYGFR